MMGYTGALRGHLAPQRNVSVRAIGIYKVWELSQPYALLSSASWPVVPTRNVLEQMGIGTEDILAGGNWHLGRG